MAWLVGCGGFLHVWWLVLVVYFCFVLFFPLSGSPKEGIKKTQLLEVELKHKGNQLLGMFYWTVLNVSETDFVDFPS